MLTRLPLKRRPSPATITAPAQMEGVQTGEHTFDIVPTRYHPSRSHDPTARTRMLCNHCCAEPVQDQQAERNRRFACVERGPHWRLVPNPSAKQMARCGAGTGVCCGRRERPASGDRDTSEGVLHGPRPGTQPEAATTNMSEAKITASKALGMGSKAKTGSFNHRFACKISVSTQKDPELVALKTGNRTLSTTTKTKTYRYCYCRKAKIRFHGFSLTSGREPLLRSQLFSHAIHYSHAGPEIQATQTAEEPTRTRHSYPHHTASNADIGPHLESHPKQITHVPIHMPNQKKTHTQTTQTAQHPNKLVTHNPHAIPVVYMGLSSPSNATHPTFTSPFPIFPCPFSPPSSLPTLTTSSPPLPTTSG